MSCKECLGGTDRPCKGNGKCHGSGTRGGSGKCKCKLGYKGDMCDVCDDRHYEIHRNDTHTECKACHKACKTSCSGDGPRACDECDEGWKFVKVLGCRDINECLEKPCGEKEYCSNKEGSYSCLSCSIACGACYGPGSTKCRFCSDGFGLNNSECQDIDECQSDGKEDLCQSEGQLCQNTPGSYSCICQPGYAKNASGDCVWQPIEEPTSTDSETEEDEVEDLPKPVKKKRAPQCATCQEIVNNFQLGLDRTRKSNYGGGNTNWEESRLGRYYDSEMRLVEIMDDLCFQASEECPQVLEDYEDVVEEFWFKSGLEKEGTVFYKYFCIDNVKACCPVNTYGPDCTECVGGVDRPCKGNGNCDGAGTRQGTGKCNCTAGYEGEMCGFCSKSYYETFSNDTHIVCAACDPSCKTCGGEGPRGCDECNDGWAYNQLTGCQDINECLNNPCEENQYCENTEGSFTCESCDVSCGTCSGPGYAKCVTCNDGYLMKDAECLDIDECKSEGHEKRCILEGEQCENTPGSYVCTCQTGYIKNDLEQCVQDQTGESEPPNKEVGLEDTDLPAVKAESSQNVEDKFTDESMKDEL